jgi:hypothetical protein
MKKRGWPVTVFLNGACGNLHFADPTRNGVGMTREQIADTLAADADKVIAAMTFVTDARLGGKSRTIQLPYRAISEAEVKGTVRGAQRFDSTGLYDRGMPALLARIRNRGTQPAEVQALFVNDHAFVGIPAEYFVQDGLRIKEEAYPKHALIVSCTNGMVGYVPHKEAFRRGGYETTFWGGSMLAPEAGDLLADTACHLLKFPKSTG